MKKAALALTASRDTSPGTSTPEADDAVSRARGAALFHGLADPTRLAILQHLTLGEHRVRDLTDHLGLAQSTVSAHLACLRDCGLVRSRPVGRASMFSLTTEPELRQLLRSAESQLAALGHPARLCPHLPPEQPIVLLAPEHEVAR